MSHCPTINLAHLAPWCIGNNHELYDEMPTHVLADLKVMGDSLVLSGMLTLRRKPLASFDRITALVEFFFFFFFFFFFCLFCLQNNTDMLSFIL